MPITNKILLDVSVLKDPIGNEHCLWPVTEKSLVTGIVCPLLILCSLFEVFT